MEVCLVARFVPFLCLFGGLFAREDCQIFDLGCHLRNAPEVFQQVLRLPEEVINKINQESSKVVEPLRGEFERIVQELYQTGVSVTDTILQQIRVTINSFVDKNPYYGRSATVRRFAQEFEMAPEEVAYAQVRSAKAKQAIERLIGKPISDVAMPRVGICCSGGGFRAMCALAGALTELEKQGILDASLYLATLSGATWAVAPWAITALSYQAFVGDFKKRVSRAVLGAPLNQKLEMLASISSLVADVIIKKLVMNDLLVEGLGVEQNFGGVFSAIDLYGILLGASLFTPEQLKNYINLNLASMEPMVKDGQKPLPIFTAVHPRDRVCGVYDWYEFTPFEVASYASRGAAPAWAWGRPFNGGDSVAYPSPISLGECMAIFGSAFSVSFEEAYRHNFLPVGPVNDLLKGFIDKTARVQLELAKGLGVDSMACNNRPPFGVSWENNFMYQLPGHLTKRRQVPFVDAGIAFGVPVVPLMYRDLDLIIVFDVAESLDAHEFLANEDYARLHSLPFPRLDRTVSKNDPKRLAINEHVYSVFDDGPNNTKAPIVMYLPLTKNPNYSAFDPRDTSKNGFLNTFNLSYTPEQIDLLSGLYAQGVRDVTPEIKNILSQIVNRKLARNQVK